MDLRNFEKKKTRQPQRRQEKCRLFFAVLVFFTILFLLKTLEFRRHFAHPHLPDGEEVDADSCGGGPLDYLEYFLEWDGLFLCGFCSIHYGHFGIK